VCEKVGVAELKVLEAFRASMRGEPRAAGSTEAAFICNGRFALALLLTLYAVADDAGGLMNTVYSSGSRMMQRQSNDMRWLLGFFETSDEFRAAARAQLRESVPEGEADTTAALAEAATSSVDSPD